MMKKVFMIMSAVLALCSCGPKLSDVKITDCKLESVSISGMHALDAVLDIKVDNPVRAIDISEVTGTVKIKGEPALQLKAPDVRLEAKCERYYKLPVTCVVDPEFSFFTLLNSIGNADFGAFSADISAKVKMENGLGTILSFKDVPIGSMSK